MFPFRFRSSPPAHLKKRITPPPTRYFICLVLMIGLVFGLTSCGVLLGPELPTPIPSQYLPTVIAQTAQAGEPTLEPEPEESDATVSPTEPAADVLVDTATPQPSPTRTPPGPSVTPYTLPAPSSPTPDPGIPNAAIEIRNLGAYSKVTSPLHIYAYLKPGAGGKVRIELIGEDNRVLVRNIKTMNFVPTGAWAVMSLDLDFEISATAEAAWLKISVDDEFGRTVAMNSVPLILLSIGDADIVPPMDLMAPIIIREPTKQTLIQGGTLLVTGMARPGGTDPLMVRLVTAEGKEVGMRLAGVDDITPGGYGTFAAEVPYKVDNPTKALLTVTEGADSISDVIHLVSIEVMLSP